MADRHQAQAYPLRLPDELKSRIAEEAKASGRSLNAEIVARLEGSLEQRQDGKVDPAHRALIALTEMQTTILQKFSVLLQRADTLLDDGATPHDEAVEVVKQIGRDLEAAVAPRAPSEFSKIVMRGAGQVAGISPAPPQTNTPHGPPKRPRAKAAK